MQPFVQPLIARSSPPAISAPQRSSIDHRPALAPAAPVLAPLTPFQAAMLFIQHKQHTKPKAVAYAAFLAGGQLVALEWLHNQRGHNPTVNIDRVVRRAKQHSATHVILATWVRSASEKPYAVEFYEEVDWQHTHLADNGLTLIDNLRLSETGMFSYYAAKEGPFEDASFGDTYHGVSHHYRYGN